MNILMRSLVLVLEGIALDEDDGIDVIFICEIGNRVSTRKRIYSNFGGGHGGAVREEGSDWHSSLK